MVNLGKCTCLALPLMATLSGCGVEGFEDDADADLRAAAAEPMIAELIDVLPPAEPGLPNCADEMKLEAELSFHILNGVCDASLCTFDYDPVATPLIANISGSYDRDTGDFAWTESYVNNHWRAATSVVGNGIITEAGNELSSFVRTTTDKFGVDFEEAVDIKRTGCDIEVRTTRDGVTLTDVGTLVGDTMFEIERIPALWGGDFPIEGSINGDEEVVEIEPSEDAEPFWWGYRAETYMSGKTRVTDFKQWSPLLERMRSGICEFSLTGTSLCELDIDTKTGSGFAAWSYNYAGNGSGFFEFEGDTCDISWDEGVCSKSCDIDPDPSCADFLFTE